MTITAMASIRRRPLGNGRGRVLGIRSRVVGWRGIVGRLGRRMGRGCLRVEAGDGVVGQRGRLRSWEGLRVVCRMRSDAVGGGLGLVLMLVSGHRSVGGGVTRRPCACGREACGRGGIRGARQKQLVLAPVGSAALGTAVVKSIWVVAILEALAPREIRRVGDGILDRRHMAVPPLVVASERHLARRAKRAKTAKCRCVGGPSAKRCGVRDGDTGVRFGSGHVGQLIPVDRQAAIDDISRWGGSLLRGGRGATALLGDGDKVAADR